MIHQPPSRRVILALSLSTLLVSLLLASGCVSSGPTPAAAPGPTAPAVATLEPVSATFIPHEVRGQEQCGSCHQDDMPEDHAEREDRTCQVCHYPAPEPHEVSGASTAEKGQIIWQERANLSCRDCHGFEGTGGFGPALVGTGLDAETFLQRTRSPLSERMPPIAASLDDPSFEASGVWINDEDLLMVYTWLSGREVEESAPVDTSAAPSIPHAVEGQEDCLMCHAPGGALPVPDDHTGWTNEDCLGCHVAE